MEYRNPNKTETYGPKRPQPRETAVTSAPPNSCAYIAAYDLIRNPQITQSVKTNKNFLNSFPQLTSMLTKGTVNFV